MTPNWKNDALSYHDCLRSPLCRYGDDKCFQQQLPFSMQKKQVYDGRDISKDASKTELTRQADLYRTSIYRLDYCESPDITDHYPLEHTRHPNVKFTSTFGSPLHDSTYRNDFPPWGCRDQALCRSKLHVPDSDATRGDASRHPAHDEYNYYCPPHYRGNEKRENYLLDYERQINMRPPDRRTCPVPKKPPHPSSKYSNYMLDYKSRKIPAKRRFVKRGVDFNTLPYSMSSKTTYKDAFGSTPELRQKPRKMEGQADNYTMGYEPMVQETTTMRDFMDPDVRRHPPVRSTFTPDVYHRPTCSMETTTTNGRTYGWEYWKNLPVQVRPKTHSDDEDASSKQRETDVRRRIATYQGDFNGINALCPCRVVEKYGSRVLEPCYSCRKSNSLHDLSPVLLYQRQ